MKFLGREDMNRYKTTPMSKKVKKKDEGKLTYNERLSVHIARVPASRLATIKDHECTM